MNDTTIHLIVRVRNCIFILVSSLFLLLGILSFLTPNHLWNMCNFLYLLYHTYIRSLEWHESLQQCLRLLAPHPLLLSSHSFMMSDRPPGNENTQGHCPSRRKEARVRMSRVLRRKRRSELWSWISYSLDLPL